MKSVIPPPATPLTPPSPPSHHKTILPISSARALACSHIVSPIAGCQVRAGARISAGREPNSEKTGENEKSRQIEAVSEIGRV